MRLVLGCMVVVAAACSSSKSGGPQGSPGGKRGGTGGGKLEYPVDVAPLAVKQMTYTVSATGTLDAFQQVQITARVAGAVDKVAFTEGQQVKAGDVLATIESERYSIALDQAKTAVAKADAAEKAAESALARRLSAQKESPGLVPGEEIEQKQTAVDSAKADLAAAKEAQKVAELNLRDSSVRAPIAGVVQTRTVQQGQYLQPGYVLATILQRDPMQLRFEVTEADARRLKPGMAATFRLRESQLSYTATLTLVAGAADPATRMVPVTARVDATEHQWSLRPGAFADLVSVPVGDAWPGIVVPSLAVKPSEKGDIVFLVDDQHIAHETPVKVGMHTADGGVEITEGVKAGQLLVVRGIDPLTDGAPVKIGSTLTLEQALKPPPPGEDSAAGSGAGSDAGSNTGPDGGSGRGRGTGHRRGSGS